MNQPVLEVKNLVKQYGKFTAVNKVSFSVPKGKVIGLLGPNGAGKTTTIQMLLGITLPTSGQISYFGQDFATHSQASLSRINFASAYNTLQGRITVMENLLVFARLYGVAQPKQKIAELMKYFEVERVAKQLYWDLSAGEQTRVNLIKSLLNDPELILMDEPTASLDPDIGDKTLSLIEDLRQSRGLSILFTSHKMDEVTRICDEVIFLDHGKLVRQDTPLGLTKAIKSAQLRVTFVGKREAVEQMLVNEKQSYQFERDYTVVIKTKEKLIPELIFKIDKTGVKVTDIEIKKPDLEDVFLQIARGQHE